MGSLDTSMQSDGTLRALTLLPALYYACKQGKTVVVDEINCCLSPTMVKGIVEYFAKTADTNGQLIFTTHDNQLLDERDILRSDEIWFVDKREGASGTERGIYEATSKKLVGGTWTEVMHVTNEGSEQVEGSSTVRRINEDMYNLYYMRYSGGNAYKYCETDHLGLNLSLIHI